LNHEEGRLPLRSEFESSYSRELFSLHVPNPRDSKYLPTVDIIDTHHDDIGAATATEKKPLPGSVSFPSEAIQEAILCLNTAAVKSLKERFEVEKDAEGMSRTLFEAKNALIAAQSTWGKQGAVWWCVILGFVWHWGRTSMDKEGLVVPLVLQNDLTRIERESMRAKSRLEGNAQS